MICRRASLDGGTMWRRSSSHRQQARGAGNRILTGCLQASGGCSGASAHMGGKCAGFQAEFCLATVLFCVKRPIRRWNPAQAGLGGGVGDRRGSRIVAIKRWVSQWDRCPIQRFQARYGRLGGEGIGSGKEKCFESGVGGGRSGEKAAGTVLRADIGTEVGHGFGAAGGAGLASHEGGLIGEGDEIGRASCRKRV